MTKQHIASRRVVIGRGDELSIVPACIALVDARIESVEVLAEEDYAARVAALHQVVDYGDHLVTPAFVNGHTHLALGFLRGFDLRAATRGNMVEELFFAVETALTPDDVSAFARMGAYESLLGGVGLVWDHYYHAEHVAAALRDVGLAAVVAPTLQDLAGPGKDVSEQQLDATRAIAGDASLAERGIFAALGPHATDTVSAALWGRAVAIAQELALPLHAHLAQSPEEHLRACRRHGVPPVAWLERIGVLEGAPRAAWAHAIYVSDAELELLAAERHTLMWCPYSALVFGLPARVGAWAARGLRWGVATDCASNNDAMNVQAELRMIAAQRTVGASFSAAYDDMRAGVDGAVAALWDRRSALLSEHEALASPASMLARVWSIPGTMHPAFVAGVIEAGALANVVVWDTNHPAMWPALDPLHTLTMADATKAIHAMYVAGRRIGRDGDFQRSIVDSDGFRAARLEASERLTRLLDQLDQRARTS